MTRLHQATTLMELLEVGDSSHLAIRVPGGCDLTYDSLRRQVAALAMELNAIGIHRGDRVALVLPNSAEGIILFLAAATAGTAAPLNPAYKADEFQFYLEDTDAKMLITPSEGGDTALSVVPEGTAHAVAWMDANGDVSLRLKTGHRNGKVSDGLAVTDDVALVLHTSGTTSRPKRVPLAHRNLVASVRSIIETYQLTPDDVSLCVMPLFHVHGLVASTLATLASGGTVVAPQRFPMNFWPLVKEYGVTWYTAVPTMHNVLLSRARSGGSRQDPSMYRGLRFIRSCSAPLSPGTMQEMEECFGAPVLEAYGMTEASHQIASNPLPPDERVPGSVGKATGVDVAIMDEDGALLSPGETGEIVVKGPSVIDGYEDNPEANATSFVNGWFRTGDQGVLNESGYLKLVGRIKELINRSGEKISPIEIDEVLCAHPSVSEAVAFGIPHPTHGEQPSAAVVLSSEVTEADLVKYCKEHLADFKAPRVIHIVEQIPRTPTGKVQRRVVAAAFSDRLALV